MLVGNARVSIDLQSTDGRLTHYRLLDGTNFPGVDEWDPADRGRTE